MPAKHDGKLVNQRQIAEINGVSAQTIRDWISSGLPTRKGLKGERLYLPSEVIRWREERAERVALDSVAVTDIDEAKRRKMAAEAAMAELELATRRGEVAEIAVVADEVGAALASCRGRLIGIGATTAPRLAVASGAVEMRRIVDEAIHDALEEISDGVLGFAGRAGGAGQDGDPGEGDGDDDAAATTDSEPVG